MTTFYNPATQEWENQPESGAISQAASTPVTSPVIQSTLGEYVAAHPDLGTIHPTRSADYNPYEGLDLTGDTDWNFGPIPQVDEFKPKGTLPDIQKLPQVGEITLDHVPWADFDSSKSAQAAQGFDPTGLDKQWSTAPTFNSDSTDASAGIQSGWSKSLGDGKTQQYDMLGTDKGITQDKSTWDSIKPILAIAGLAATGGALSGAGAFGGAGAAGSSAGFGGYGGLSGSLSGGLTAGGDAMLGGALADGAGYGGLSGALSSAGTGALSTAATSAAEKTIMEQLASQFGKQFTLDAVGQSALKNAAIQLATTGKVDLKSVALGAMVSPIANTAGGMIGGMVDNNTLSGALSGATAGGLTAGLTGGNVVNSALAGGVLGASAPLLKDVKDYGNGLWNDTKKFFGFSPEIDAGKGIGGWTSDNGAIEDAYVPTKNYDFKAEYGLGAGPTGIRNNIGFNADINPTIYDGETPVDYSNNFAPTKDFGFQLPTYPDLTAMGGGQGLTTETMEGTVGALGLAPDGSSIVLGDPKSFINNPTILGNTVIGTDTLLNPDGSGTTPKDKEKSKDLASQYRFSFNNGQSKKREFGDIPIPELIRMGFDPALIALLKGAQNG